MNSSGQYGKIILLNGASSSGKSTLARALQAAIDEPFWHFSIDHLRDAGVLPMARIRSGEFAWSQIREAFFRGFRESLPTFARSGNNLIVEHILESEEWRADLERLLSPFDVFFVGVHCSLAELERRESARGDRPIGDARRDFGMIHRHASYDLEVDSTDCLERNVERLIRAWRSRSSPSVFHRKGIAQSGKSVTDRPNSTPTSQD